MSELRLLAEESLGAIAEPTFTYAEVRREYIAAKTKLGARISFKEFMKETGLDKQIFRLGSKGAGARLLLKSDVVEAFKKIQDIFRNDLDSKKKAYKKPNSPKKKYNGKLLGYALKHGSRIGGRGEDSRNLKHKLHSYEMWEEISTALKKNGLDEEVAYLESLRDRAGIPAPRAPKKAAGK